MCRLWLCRHSDAITALKFLKGNGILAQFAKLQEHDSTNLYIANLPKSYTKENIHTLLSPFGTVTSYQDIKGPGTPFYEY